jgi:hypothetical protein
VNALGSSLGLLGTLALASLPTPAAAQPVGEEFQVNTYTTEDQRTGAGVGHFVATDAGGNFVVVWTSYYQDGSFSGIFGQRFESAGGPLGTEFRVNSYTTHYQNAPAVAADPSGNFVVVWSGRDQGDSDGVFGQRYDSGGTALGTVFRVNSYTTGSQGGPDVASDASGNFIVVWSSLLQDGGDWGVFGQRYDSEGVAQGDEFRINTNTSASQRANSVASASNGDFVVVWQSIGQSGPGQAHEVYGQRYDSTGVPRGEEFRVNSFMTYPQEDASVAMDASGNFVVVWSGAGPGDRLGIFGQRFNSEGMRLGTEFPVSSYVTSGQIRPSVTSDASGNFTVVWASTLDQDGSNTGIFGQRYDSEGVAQGDEFQVNTYTTSSQNAPDVGLTGDNQFVVAWESGGQDGSGDGVFAQRFDFGSAQAIAVVSPNNEVRWRIGSLQKIQWTHNLGAEATFRIELDRDDDGDYEEVIAAAAPVDSPTKGGFAWTVTGPPSGAARVRVSWTDDPGVADASDVTFQIRPLGLDAERENR